MHRIKANLQTPGSEYRHSSLLLRLPACRLNVASVLCVRQIVMKQLVSSVLHQLRRAELITV